MVPLILVIFYFPDNSIGYLFYFILLQCVLSLFISHCLANVKVWNDMLEQVVSLCS